MPNRSSDWPGPRQATQHRLLQLLRRKLGAQALLVTRGEEGMTLFQDGGRLHVATQVREAEAYDIAQRDTALSVSVIFTNAAG